MVGVGVEGGGRRLSLLKEKQTKTKTAQSHLPFHYINVIRIVVHILAAHNRTKLLPIETKQFGVTSPPPKQTNTNK